MSGRNYNNQGRGYFPNQYEYGYGMYDAQGGYNYSPYQQAYDECGQPVYMTPEQYHAMYGGGYEYYDEGYDQLDETDYANLDEIDKALDELHQDNNEEYEEYQEYHEHSDLRPPSTGALPSDNGVLSAYASEFWFPECRDCTCCNGYKHGCKCCVGGVTSCSCTSGVPAHQQAPSTHPVVDKPTSQSDQSSEKGSTSNTQTSSTACASSGSGDAIPSTTSSAQESEKTEQSFDPDMFYPECRDCICCQGFKYGCECRIMEKKSACYCVIDKA